MRGTPRKRESIVFHDLQQGGRTLDLPYYRELARRADATLELGAGTGRVALELAALTDLWANDLDDHLLEELVRRAEARGLSVTPLPGDATELDIGRSFDLIIAPVGFAQSIGGQSERQALLRVIRRHLTVTGVAVVALVDVDEVLRECRAPAAPQRLRARGRTFVCRQLGAAKTEGGARVIWRRGVYRRSAGRVTGRAVVPAVLSYHRLSPEGLAADARACGLHASHVHHDPGDATSLGSMYCVLHHSRLRDTRRAMSQENAEIVRVAFQTFGAEGIDAALSYFSPDFVWYPTDRWLEGHAYRGHDGMRSLGAAFSENFDDFRYEVRDIRDAQDRVVALVDMIGRIKPSGAEVSQRLGFVVSGFRDGTFREVRAFTSWHEALAAVGLTE